MKRSELYERVWSTPASKLAEELGISGSRVAAICKRHGIPTPPRGYWAKRDVGKHVPKTALPQPEVDYELKLRTPERKPEASAWVAPGVLHRPEPPEPPPLPQAGPLNKPKPAEAWPFSSSPEASPAPKASAAQANTVQVDLDLVRAAAAELQARREIEALLQAVAVRAMQNNEVDAKRILEWASAARAQLAGWDPVANLLRSAALLNADR